MQNEENIVKDSKDSKDSITIRIASKPKFLFLKNFLNNN